MNDLAETDWSMLKGSSSATETAISFMAILTDTFLKHTTTVQVSRSKYNMQPWMTPGLMRCSKHKDKLHLITRADPDNAIKKLEFTRYRNFYITLLRRLRDEYDAKDLSAAEKIHVPTGILLKELREQKLLNLTHRNY